MPKYVVSSTLEDPEWNNSTVLKGDVVEEVSKLRQELDGEIVVAGSIRLVRTLMEHDLVDELRLMIYPVVLGAGEHLFVETSDQKPVRLVETRTVDDLAYLTYEPVRDGYDSERIETEEKRQRTPGDAVGGEHPGALAAGEPREQPGSEQQRNQSSQSQLPILWARFKSPRSACLSG